MLNLHGGVQILMHQQETKFFTLFLFVDTKITEYRLLHFDQNTGTEPPPTS